ncbi:MAG: hypothetical protein JWL62_3504, partial [Hyphomicrobiales bacterium]|nr:hypothetical protein [Hyphomicrobiales bacterium]
AAVSTLDFDVSGSHRGKRSKARRGLIHLRDRGNLESLACGSYGVPEKEYARLMGPIPDERLSANP